MDQVAENYPAAFSGGCLVGVDLIFGKNLFLDIRAQALKLTILSIFP
jgi:hypothetical protein